MRMRGQVERKAFEKDWTYCPTPSTLAEPFQSAPNSAKLFGQLLSGLETPSLALAWGLYPTAKVTGYYATDRITFRALLRYLALDC